MATPTPNIGLHRSEVEDLVNLSQDFNTNWDLIDAYVGAAKGSLASIAARLAICLANSGGIKSGTTFPETPTLGQLFYKSDTEILYIRSSDSWDTIGIYDHGGLAGLADDDHSQYLNNARHDVVARHTLGSVVPHDALASLTEKSHANLSNVTAAQHHAKAVSSDIDHGGVGGLGDDDHGQYLNNARHDTTTRHPVSVIKTAMGSDTGSLTADQFTNIVLHRKAFFPQLAASEYLVMWLSQTGTNPNDYIGRFAIKNAFANERSYWIQWDYLSASGPPTIWCITDDLGKMIHCWEAEDPPDIDNPNLIPIKVGKGESSAALPGYHSIKVVIPSNYKAIKNIARQTKQSFSGYLLSTYNIDLATKKLRKRPTR